MILLKPWHTTGYGRHHLYDYDNDALIALIIDNKVVSNYVSCFLYSDAIYKLSGFDNKLVKIAADLGYIEHSFAISKSLSITSNQSVDELIEFLKKETVSILEEYFDFRYPNDKQLLLV